MSRKIGCVCAPSNYVARRLCNVGHPGNDIAALWPVWLSEYALERHRMSQKVIYEQGINAGVTTENGWTATP